MNSQEFEVLVSKIGFSSVPEKFRGLISNVALIIEDDVSFELRHSMSLPGNETLLGLYRGIPLSKRGVAYSNALPDTITLFRLPILNAAVQDGISVEQMIKDTVWHEVAHHFGLNEEEVRQREKENGSRINIA